MKKPLNAALAIALIAAGLAACSVSHESGAEYRQQAPGASAPEGDWNVTQELRSSYTNGVDEILIIQRSLNRQVTRPSLPGSGQLITAHSGSPASLPLEFTEVVIDVLGPIANGSVKQTFTNPYNVPIEARYVFPLPHDAAVHDFLLTIGARTIRGIVRERDEAQAIYNAARAQGLTAALMTQERPNIFTQNVANIAAHASIDVTMRYLESVDTVDGWQEIAFPMVVGPRYAPVGHDDAKSVGAGRALTRNGSDIALRVNLDAGLAVERLMSPSHAVTIDEENETVRIELSSLDSIPNRDFVLRWQIPGEGLRTSLVAEGEYALLTLYPPALATDLPRQAIEHVFVLDTSGSMKGGPLRILKAAVHAALASLAPDDMFHILSFNNETGHFASAPLGANRKNVSRAHRYVDELVASGGTELVPAIVHALARPSLGGRPRVITVLSDGLVSNEDEVLTAIQNRRADARVFSFGIGGSPNRWLMAEIALRSGGAAAFVGLREDPQPIVAAYFERIARPAVSDLEITWNGATAIPASIAPSSILAGRAVVLPYQLRGGRRSVEAIVTGDVDGVRQELARVVCRPRGGGGGVTSPTDASGSILGKIWGRERISALGADLRMGLRQETITRDMTKVALQFGLVSDVTSFVCVDSIAGATYRGAPPAVAEVPGTIPAGMEYETSR